MKRKFLILSICSLILSLALFLFSYVLFHYLGPDMTFSPVWREEAAKPLVTELFANLGVLFLFGSIMSLMVSLIFFTKNNK